MPPAILAKDDAAIKPSASVAAPKVRPEGTQDGDKQAAPSATAATLISAP